MKNLYFVAIAALLALAIVSCDNFTAPKTSKVAGDGLVSLSLGTGGTSRALNAALGKAGTTYYEASFKQVVGADTFIVRTSWNWATVGRITLAPGTYEVILLAGRGSDKTLLGVGRVTGVDGAGVIATPADNVTIAADSTELTFTVGALANLIAINATNPIVLPAGMTFTTSSIGTTASVVRMWDEYGNAVPVFSHIKNDAGVTGTWTFSIGGVAGNLGTLPGVSPDLLIAPAGGNVLSTGHSSRDSNNVPYDLPVTWAGPAAGDPIGTTGFTFTFTTPGEDGAAYIAVEVPVNAFAPASSPNAADPIIWYIRGGLNNGMIDAGAIPSNPTQKQGQLGGAIVIGFGNLDSLPELKLVPQSWQ